MKLSDPRVSAIVVSHLRDSKKPRRWVSALDDLAPVPNRPCRDTQPASARSPANRSRNDLCPAHPTFFDRMLVSETTHSHECLKNDGNIHTEISSADILMVVPQLGWKNFFDVYLFWI